MILNPAVFGDLPDESGCADAGLLIWSERAFTQLLFGTPSHPEGGEGADWRDVTALDLAGLTKMDDKLFHERMTLWFGFAEHRICVLGVSVEYPNRKLRRIEEGRFGAWPGGAKKDGGGPAS